MTRSNRSHEFRFVCAAIVMSASLVGFVTSIKAENNAASGAMPGRLIDVADTKLHLTCQGHGRPTIMLEAGLGGNYLDWTYVQPALATDFTVCAYDRAGIGFSEPSEQPKSADHIADQLHDLIRAGQIDLPRINLPQINLPIVLVGHSFGGLMALYYASRYPDDVSGLVLLDPMHPDQFERFRKAGVDLPTEPNLVMGRTATFAATYRLPESMTALAIRLAEQDTARIATIKEMRWMIPNSAEIKAIRLPHIATRILLHGNREWDSAYPDGRMEDAWHMMHSDLAEALGAPPPLTIVGSGHQIQLDQPEAVVDVIREMAKTIQKSSP